MARKPVIGFAGKAYSGKDTAAAFAIAAFGGYKYSFADPVRAMLKPLGIDMSDPYWIANKEVVIPAIGVSPRYLMQSLGTEWGRTLVNKDMWILLAHQRLLTNGPGMVMADIRYEEEASWVRSQGGVVIHISRDSSNSVLEHSSEAGVAFVLGDASIVNTGTLDELQHNVRSVLDGS